MNGWNNLRAMIPNTPGLEIEVQLADGSTKRTAVVLLDGNGVHVLRDVSISNVVAWRRVRSGPVAALKRWAGR